MTTTTCKCVKCNGTGFIPAFSGIANGVCFSCKGSGSVTVKTTKANLFSPINAWHCESVEEANEFRLAEFYKRFPDIRLDEEDTWKVANGCGSLKDIVASYQK